MTAIQWPVFKRKRVQVHGTELANARKQVEKDMACDQEMHLEQKVPGRWREEEGWRKRGTKGLCKRKLGSA